MYVAMADNNSELLILLLSAVPMLFAWNRKRLVARIPLGTWDLSKKNTPSESGGGPWVRLGGSYIHSRSIDKVT
jgi:hypothetical protein